MRFLFFLLFCLTTMSAQEAGMPQWGRSNSDLRNGMNGQRSASLQGQVLLHDGTPATQVTVRITGASGSQQAMTDGQGFFQFAEMLAGTYEVEAETGTLSVHETVMLNSGGSDVKLQFDGESALEEKPAGSSVSVQQLKIPDKARKQYEKAVEEAGKQKSEDALNHLEQALNASPCYTDALTLKSLLDLGANRTALAAQEGQKAVSCDGSNARAYFVLGAVFNAQGRPEDAMRALNEGIRFQPDAWQAYYEMGKSLLSLRRWAEAAAQLKRAEKLVQDRFPPLNALLGQALLQMKDYHNASAQFLLFLKASPGHPDAPKVKALMEQIEKTGQANALSQR